MHLKYIPSVICFLSALHFIGCNGNVLSGNLSESKAIRSSSIEKFANDGSTSSPIPRIENADGSESRDFSMGEEASIATDITGAYLSLPKGTTELGKAYSVRSESPLGTSDWNAFRITLPSSDTSSPNMVVFYRIQTTAFESYGLIPLSQLRLEPGAVSFQLEGSGIYQVARTPILVEKPLSVPITENSQWSFKSSLKLTSLGKPYDFGLYNGDLFVTSDLQLEYFKEGSQSSKKLISDTSMRRLAVSTNRIYLAAQARGLAFFTGLTAINGEYQGNLLTSVTSVGGTFELGSANASDSMLVLLQEAGTVGDVAQLGFFSTAVENPAMMASYRIAKTGSHSLSPVTSNLSTTLGNFAVRRDRIYALLTDGLHSLERSDLTGIVSDTVIGGLDQPYCLAPGASDSLVFVCHKVTSVSAVQTTDNTKPLIIGGFDNSEKWAQLALDKSLLFALTVSGKLYVYDVADPKKMIRRGEPLDLGLQYGAPVQMKVLNGKLYIGYERNTIIVHSY